MKKKKTQTEIEKVTQLKQRSKIQIIQEIENDKKQQKNVWAIPASHSLFSSFQ